MFLPRTLHTNSIYNFCTFVLSYFVFIVHIQLSYNAFLSAHARSFTSDWHRHQNSQLDSFSLSIASLPFSSWQLYSSLLINRTFPPHLVSHVTTLVTPTERTRNRRCFGTSEAPGNSRHHLQVFCPVLLPPLSTSPRPRRPSRSASSRQRPLQHLARPRLLSGQQLMHPAPLSIGLSNLPGPTLFGLCNSPGPDSLRPQQLARPRLFSASAAVARPRLSSAPAALAWPRLFSAPALAALARPRLFRPQQHSPGHVSLRPQQHLPDHVFDLSHSSAPLRSQPPIQPATHILPVTLRADLGTVLCSFVSLPQPLWFFRLLFLALSSFREFFFSYKPTGGGVL